MLLCLEAGEAHNVVPGHARAEVKCRQGIPDVFLAEGVSTHAAFPEGSVNAFVYLLKTLEEDESLKTATRAAFRFLVEALEEWDGRGLGVALHDAFLGDTTVVPVSAQYREGVLRVALDLRYPSIVGDDWVIRKLSRAFEDSGFEVIVADSSPGRFDDPHDAKVEMLTRIVNEELDTDMEPYAMGGAIHARWIPGALGFGPGRRGNQAIPAGFGAAHEMNEAVRIADLGQSIMVYVRAILALDEMPLRGR